ncbi:MAG: helix-turn-helix transcriptional regulator [Acidobacteriota bacterium]
MKSLNGSRKLGEYLKTLRRGYGYSLRTVEYKAKQEGSLLDNSQLSRYEKGTCFPSFDKLKILADIFNVSIQSFSDVVELEKFERYKDPSKGFHALMEMGQEAFKSGYHGKAYALFESALESLGNGNDGKLDELKSKARCSKAIALEKMGKLGAAEHELRAILKTGNHLKDSTLLSVLIELSNIHMELGETFIASIEARTCHEMAVRQNNARSTAFALHLLGSIASQNGENEKAIAFYREARNIHEKSGNDQEVINLNINIGSRLIASGKFQEGVHTIKEAIRASEGKGFMRCMAFGLNKLAEACLIRGDHRRAKHYARRSDACSENSDERYIDIKFLNAFYLWKIGIKEKNEIDEKLAFGRLRCLRKSLERRFPEVDEFDSFIERRRSS